MGGAVTALCGLALWQMPAVHGRIDASYDYSFRFSARPVTNQVALILMDNAAHQELHQVRGHPWERRLQASLLEKLTDDECPLVVFDVLFLEEREHESDEALARAIRRHGRVVLAGEVTGCFLSRARADLAKWAWFPTLTASWANPWAPD